jgi:beta-galactosidase
MTKLLLFALLLSKDTIITSLVPKTPGSSPATTALSLLNNASTPLKNIVLDWELQVNGTITKKGKKPLPPIASNQPILIRLPLHLPDDTAGESFLQLRYHSTTTLLAEQQILLTPYRPRLTITPTGEITLSDDNDILTIHSPSICISFNRQTGWLVHYEIRGIDLLDDTLGLRSNFWWPGYNDSASYATDSGWLAATREPHLQLFSNTTSPEQIIIRTEYTLPATASLLHLSYTINAGGEMLISQQVEPDTTQPPSRQWPMPCFGMQWVLPSGYDSITAYGPHGIFHDRPRTSATSDPDTRATATRTAIRWWTITDKKGNGLRFIADTPLLNESAIYHPTSRSQIQISIDRPAQTLPSAPPTSSPILKSSAPPTPPPSSTPTSMGNLRYTYKVKPLISSPHL